MAFSVSEGEVCPITGQRMAESVTRHALISERGEFYFLLCGIDSLDLGFFVHWAEHWDGFKAYLQEGKEKAAGANGFLDKTAAGRQFLHLPSGKAPNYRYHLQFPEFHAYISISHPPRKSPNVYISLNASALWGLGVNGATDQAILDLASFCGSVVRIVPSRLDLCADYLIPGGLSLEFLQSHAVARSRAESHHLTGGVLETFYSGAPGAPIRLRIYDKSKEIRKSGKLWFEDLWGVFDASDVWRVEYQLRRSVLKQFSINSIDDLPQKLAGIWSYLTEDWLSLRNLDNDQQNRRSVFPWWAHLQRRAKDFGPSLNVSRCIKTTSTASADWFISHISGCLPSFAARVGATDFHDAVIRLTSEMCQYWFERDFREELTKRRIRQAHHPTIEEGEGNEGE